MLKRSLHSLQPQSLCHKSFWQVNANGATIAFLEQLAYTIVLTLFIIRYVGGNAFLSSLTIYQHNSRSYQALIHIDQMVTHRRKNYPLRPQGENMIPHVNRR